MSERRVCSLCGDLLEEEPAIHDPVVCQETELLKGRNSIKKLKEAIDFWKNGWYDLREVIGRLSWQHNQYVCPYEVKPVAVVTPNPWVHEKDTIVQEGKLVYLKDGLDWKLVGAGTSVDAGKAIVRLMQESICPKKT